MSGIGSLTAGILLSVIGEVKDFATAAKLASYFGVVPRVSNSNETVHHGRITKRGSKTGRTALVQSALAAIKKNDCLKNYYNQVKARRGHVQIQSETKDETLITRRASDQGSFIRTVFHRVRSIKILTGNTWIRKFVSGAGGCGAVCMFRQKPLRDRL